MMENGPMQDCHLGQESHKTVFKITSSFALTDKNCYRKGKCNELEARVKRTVSANSKQHVSKMVPGAFSSGGCLLKPF